MRSWLQSLDGLLRGELTRDTSLAGGTLKVPLFGLLFLIDVLGLVYGACMGVYAVMGNGRDHLMQVPASMVKTPALFLLTLIITVPSLYTFSALMGARLRLSVVMRLMVSAIAVMIAVLSSLGPIVAFFAVCTTSYPFMLLLNVFMFVIAGLLGLRFLLRTLGRLAMVIFQEELFVTAASASTLGGAMPIVSGDKIDAPLVLPADEREWTPMSARKHRSRGARTVFYVWLLVFGLVGAQMGWVLRPFVGNPSQPFTWLRPRQSNFFEAVGKTAGNLLGWEEMGRR